MTLKAAEYHCDKHIIKMKKYAMWTEKWCESCGNSFITNKTAAKYCCKRCANIVKGKEIARLNQEAGQWFKCEICGDTKSPAEFSFNIKNDFSSGKMSHCKRCGANARETERRNKTWKDDAATILLSQSKQRAKRSNIEHDIKREDIIIPDKCPVFGTPLTREDKSTWKNAPSIDRVDNKKVM